MLQGCVLLIVQYVSVLTQPPCYTGTLALAEPRDACYPLKVALDNRAVLVDRGTCSFVEKALHAQQAGATGIIVINHMPDEPAFAMGSDQQGQAVTVVAMMVNKEAGLHLEQSNKQFGFSSDHKFVISAADFQSTTSGSSTSMGFEQHVYVPDATQAWLQKLKITHEAAKQVNASRTWQTMLMNLAATMPLPPHSSQPTNNLMSDSTSAQQCSESD